MQTKQLPSILLQDNDGGWYLVPETKATSFESACNLSREDDGRAMTKFAKYRIDGPHRLIISEWQEMG